MYYSHAGMISRLNYISVFVSVQVFVFVYLVMRNVFECSRTLMHAEVEQLKAFLNQHTLDLCFHDNIKASKNNAVEKSFHGPNSGSSAPRL